MTKDSQILNLKSFGYTHRECEFLVRAALHSGYFLRRQYCAAIGRKLGKTVDSFIAKLRQQNHIKEVDFRYRRKVYSLCSKVLFEALGEPDNRNRRQHDAQTVKARLMGFDYVLDHSAARWFPTESDKLAFFTGELGVEKECLPVWRYSSKDGTRFTLRWFVDKPLVFTLRGENVIRFCFVDPGYRTTDAFASFLRNYRPLFARLHRTEVIYLACFEGAIEPARRLFERTVSPFSAPPADPIAAEIGTYFCDKQEHAVSGLSAFDQVRLDRYREARRQFAGSHYEDLFELWKERGNSAIQTVVSPESLRDLSSRAAFSARTLSFDFSLFGSLHAGKSGD